MNVTAVSGKRRRVVAAPTFKGAVVAGVLFGVVMGMTVTPAFAAEPGPQSITDTSIQLPTGEELLRVLLLRDYNTRIVLVGTMLLGLAAGIIGSFLLLRKRSLMGDALSHATLPGIGLAFIFMTAMGGTGKSLPGLLVGATVTGLLGMGTILALRHLTRLKEDAALGIVLSVCFGIGIAVLGVIQKMSTGNAAGLESFIYGKTASMLASDAILIAVAAGVIVLACLVLFKEFGLVCFDQDYANAQGWPVMLLDGVMTALVLAVTVIGLQAVGLILIVALLITPAAAARFWTDHLPRMVITSAIIGAASGLIGAGLSALVPRLPAGAIIVVVASVIFLFSMVFGSARGVLVRTFERQRLKRTVGRQHILRALYEWMEKADPELRIQPPFQKGETGIGFDDLLEERSWTPVRLRHLIRSAEREGLLYVTADGSHHLTEEGMSEARRVVRNHRLWELYLITHADIAPSHVDQDADRLEHVLGRPMVQKLEELLAKDHPHLVMPESPHVFRKGVSQG